MPGSPCCSWHAEQPIRQEPCSAHPTERGFCYIDVKTGFHCQASSLRIPSSPSSMTGCVPHVQVHTATYCQPGCLQGGGGSFFHSYIYRCYMMQALPTVFCEDGGKRCFPVTTAPSTSGKGTSRSQPTWLKEKDVMPLPTANASSRTRGVCSPSDAARPVQPA